MKRKIRKFFRELKADPVGYCLDLLAAHRKVVLAGGTVLLVQFVDSDTADWIIGVVGTLLTGKVPNDSGAMDRVYPNRRRR